MGKIKTIEEITKYLQRKADIIATASVLAYSAIYDIIDNDNIISDPEFINFKKSFSEISYKACELLKKLDKINKNITSKTN